MHIGTKRVALSFSGNWNNRQNFDKCVGVPFIKALSLLAFAFTCQISDASTGSKWSMPDSSSSDNSSSSSTYSRPPKAKSYSATPDVSPFAPGSHNLALDMGQVFLMGDLGNKYEDSLGTQLHYTYGVSDLFGFDSSLGYSQHSGGQFSMVSLLSGVRMNMSWYDKIIPYIVAGFGFYRPTYQDNTSTVPGSLSAVLFGIHMGPGIDLELSKNLFFGAALTYNNMFGTTMALANGSQLGVGGGYTTFLVHLGTSF